jgi:competence protein ComEC
VRASVGRLCLVFACALAGRIAGAAPVLEAHFISVGQADAVLVKCPDAQTYMLVDSADTRYPGSKDRFRAYLGKEFAGKPQKIALAIASHPHNDHIGSMQWVLENFQVGTYVDNGEKYDSTLWSNLDKARKKQVKAGKLKYINGKQAQSAQLALCGDVSVEVFVPWAFSSKLTDTNDRSVLVRLTYRKVTFLFVGDSEDAGEAVMLDDTLRKKLAADVLKVGHHGSDTSSTAKFVMAVSPQLAVISAGERGVGTNTRYKHPRYSTLDTYSTWFANLDKGAAPPRHPPNGQVWAYDAAKKTWRQHERPKGLWLTVQDGNVVVRSDGERIDVAFTQ